MNFSSEYIFLTLILLRRVTSYRAILSFVQVSLRLSVIINYTTFYYFSKWSINIYSRKLKICWWIFRGFFNYSEKKKNGRILVPPLAWMRHQIVPSRIRVNYAQAPRTMEYFSVRDQRRCLLPCSSFQARSILARCVDAFHILRVKSLHFSRTAA